MINILNKKIMEYSWVYVCESSFIEDQYRFSFKFFRKWWKGAHELALARSKGSNVNKAFDVGIIITGIRDNKSTIRVPNTNYRSTNEVNCTLYRGDIICC